MFTIDQKIHTYGGTIITATVKSDYTDNLYLLWWVTTDDNNVDVYYLLSTDDRMVKEVISGQMTYVSMITHANRHGFKIVRSTQIDKNGEFNAL